MPDVAMMEEIQGYTDITNKKIESMQGLLSDNISYRSEYSHLVFKSDNKTSIQATSEIKLPWTIKILIKGDYNVIANINSTSGSRTVYLRVTVNKVTVLTLTSNAGAFVDVNSYLKMKEGDLVEFYLKGDNNGASSGYLGGPGGLRVYGVTDRIMIEEVV